MAKISSRTKKNIWIVAMIVCLIVFAVSAYMLYDYFAEASKAEDDYQNLRDKTPPISDEETDDYSDMAPFYKDLHEQNNDFSGWLRLYGTDISYPVMHTPKDEEYYLQRNFDKEYSRYGALFASARSDVDKPSGLVIIYGHDIKNGSMFGKLDAYTDPDYYDEHRYIRFDGLEERRSYEILLVTRTVVNTGESSEFRYYEYSDFANEADFDKFIKQAQKGADFDTGVTASFGDDLLLLSTCEDDSQNGRLLILAKAIPNSRAPKYPALAPSV
jgi:sortase B